MTPIIICRPMWKRRALLSSSAFVICAYFGASVRGIEIGPGDFNGTNAVDHSENLALPFLNPTPIAIRGNTYDTDNGALRYSDLFGEIFGRSKYAIGTDTESGYLDIQLGRATLRAGMHVGRGVNRWAADISFYDVGDNLLGTLSKSGSGHDSLFAGWQADAGSIARILLTDVGGFDSQILIVDDLIREVPEPAAAMLFGVPMVGLLRRRRFS